MTTIRFFGLLSAAATLAAPLAAQTPTAQTPTPEIVACYDAKTSSSGKPQGSGLVYRIRVPGVVNQLACVDADDVQFSWTIQHGALTGLDADDHPQYLRDGEPAGGDLAGSYANPTVDGLQTRPVAPDAPLPGQVLTWNGTAWAPAAAAGGASGTPNNVPGTLVQRDVNGGFAAGPVSLLGDFLAFGVQGSAIPATGAGGRLMWYGGKFAFRAGVVTGDQWDDAHAGFQSTGMGFSTTASGPVSTAIGNTTTASGHTSTAMGLNTIASGSVSTAMGNNTIASEEASTAMGFVTIASGQLSTAMGSNTTASGQASTAMGQGTIASGVASTAMGRITEASGSFSTAMGFNSSASALAATAMGDNTTASGDASTAMGSATTASGHFTTAMGRAVSSNNQEGSFVYGDASTFFTGGTVNATAPNSFVVRAQRVWFGKSGDQVATAARYLETSTGAFLSDGGAWTNASSRALKDDFRAEDGETVLRRLVTLPVESWHYRAEPPTVRHLGPTAEDFHAAFGLGDTDAAIATVDIDGVNLLAVQALERRTREQAREIAALRAELAALRAEIAQRKP